MTTQDRELLNGVRDALDKAIDGLPAESRFLRLFDRVNQSVTLAVGPRTGASAEARLASQRAQGERIKAEARASRGDRPAHLRLVETH